MFCRLHDDAFPLRLLPPYECVSEEAFQRYAANLQARHPRWMPRPTCVPVLTRMKPDSIRGLLLAWLLAGAATLTAQTRRHGAAHLRECQLRPA